MSAHDEAGVRSVKHPATHALGEASPGWIRRARPLLGTLVDIAIEDVDAALAERALKAAFAEVAIVHRLMSFHESTSDLARINRARAGVRLRVDARTHEVLRWALRIAAASRGCFDPTIARSLVVAGVLPQPESSALPDADANWRDIELGEREIVVLRRPLWIDLGGIAKGYAVDRAVEVLRAQGVAQAIVNAGGDLRVLGARAQTVMVRDAQDNALGAIEIADAALATSTTRHASNAVHLDCRMNCTIAARCTATVAASRGILADALTKIVLAAEDDVIRRMLREFSAQACLWRGGDAARVLAAA